MNPTVSKEFFNKLINITSLAELNNLEGEYNIKLGVTHDLNETILGVEFAENANFEFFELLLFNLHFDIIFNKGYFQKIIIKDSERVEITFNTVEINTFNSEKNGEITVNFNNCKITNFDIENDNLRILNLSDTTIKENAYINKVSFDYLYVNKSNFKGLEITDSNIEYEGLIIKHSAFETLVINNNKILRFNLLEVNSVNLSIGRTIITSFEIDNSDINYINLDNSTNIRELELKNSSKVLNISNNFSNIGRFQILDKSEIDSIILWTESHITNFTIINICKILYISVKKTCGIYMLDFQRDVQVDYIEIDEEAVVGDFHISNTTIKSLKVVKQKNSYNIQNSTINLLKLFNCQIHSLNILNGCKIEGYVSDSMINKVEFKEVNILKDTLISFSSCSIYSLLIEDFSVIGNLYFRNLMHLEHPLDFNWTDIAKYMAKPNRFDNADISSIYEQKKTILTIIKEYVFENPKWIYRIESNNEILLKKELIEKDYSFLLSENIQEEFLKKLIVELKDLYNINKSLYQRKLYEDIKRFNYNKLHNNNLEQVFIRLERVYEILDFIWTVLSRIELTDLEFKNIDKPIFRVFQSSFGKTEFSNCNLKYFEFQYNNSNFLDCIFLGTDIPDENLRILESDKTVFDESKITVESKINFFTQKTEFYNQFKKIFEKQGNIYESGLFNSRWAQNQEKLLLLKINKDENYLNKTNDINSFIKSIDLFFESENQENVMNIFTFNLNRISNNHGEDWIKSLKFILLPTFFIFSLYILSIRYDFNIKYLFCSSNLSFDKDIFAYYFNHIKYFFEFLNPARKFDFIKFDDKSYSLSFWSFLWDFLGRIIISFGIYQLIVAFRKNARKQ